MKEHDFYEHLNDAYETGEWNPEALKRIINHIRASRAKGLTKKKRSTIRDLFG